MSSVKQTVFVNAIIYNAKQQVLLVRRSLKDHFQPGYLELPGGRAEQGESLENTLKRKLQRELQITTDSGQYFTSIAANNKYGPYIRTAFQVAHDQASPINLTKAHAEYIWVGREALNDEKIMEDSRKILKQFLGEDLPAPVEVKQSSSGSATLNIYTDGGSRGNPGPSASGFVIYDEKGNLLESGGAYIGITTNNQAEYTAVILALEAAKKHVDAEAAINFSIDSLLVVNQMNGVYKIKNRDLWPLHQQIRELMKDFQQVRFNHVYREQNTEADAKVNEILDAHANGS